MKPLTTLHADQCHVVTIQDDAILEGWKVEELGNQLYKAAEDSNYRLVINFNNVERVSTAVMGKLVALRRRFINNKGRLMLCCCGEQMMEAMRVTELRRLFDVASTQEEAEELMRHEFLPWRPRAEL